MPNGVHACHHGKKNLSGAHVARRFFAPDVLLARLQRHPERRSSVGVAGDSDDSAGNQTLELIARCEVRRVRASISQRNAKSLSVADNYVRAPLAWGSQQREAEQIGGDCYERALRMSTLANFSVIEDRP